MNVCDGGETQIHVTAGLVALSAGRHESLIPAGFTCSMSATGAPCTPVAYDAVREIRLLVQHVDDGAEGPMLDLALDQILAHAGEPEAVTLWHLMQRVGPDNRARIYDRLAAIAPPPVDVSKELIAAADRPALDRWWNSLGYGAVELWRTVAPSLALR